MAVRGYNEPGGDFLVSDVCFAGLAPQAPLPCLPAGAEDKYVALLSGLHLGSSRADALRTQLLVDMLTGALGSGGDQKMSAKVGRGESVAAWAAAAVCTPVRCIRDATCCIRCPGTSCPGTQQAAPPPENEPMAAKPHASLRHAHRWRT
jgi:hypothetical protein